MGQVIQTTKAEIAVDVRSNILAEFLLAKHCPNIDLKDASIYARMPSRIYGTNDRFRATVTKIEGNKKTVNNVEFDDDLVIEAVLSYADQEVPEGFYATLDQKREGLFEVRVLLKPIAEKKPTLWERIVNCFGPRK